MSDYDLFIIGGGSGGLAAAKQAAKYGARVAIAEESLLGGTCTARGCIPKKLMVYASEFSRLFEDAKGYGWSGLQPQFDWQALIRSIDLAIDRLDQLQASFLEKAGVDLIRAKAVFVDAHTLEAGNQTITADKILIAVGSKAVKPNIPGIEHVIVSDQMFHLPEQPKRFAIVGGGYIGVEFAGIMNGLGSDVTQIIRDDRILSGFDQDVQIQVQEGMTNHGINILTTTEIQQIEKTPDGLQLLLSTEQSLMVDVVLFATGRTPNLDSLQLEKVNVKVERKAIAVNEYSQTSQPQIYAVGDCTNRVNLTPVAIAEGQAFADTVFGHQLHHVNYKNIPSAVFGQPQAACVGLTEAEACEQYGTDNITRYCDMFNPLFYKLASTAETTMMKLIVETKTDRILGLHIVGDEAAEMVQVAAIAVNAGLTKKDFDMTMPLHPTSAEELVTLQMTAMPTAAIEPCWMDKSGH